VSTQTGPTDPRPDSPSSDAVAEVLASTWAGDAEEMYRYLTGETSATALEFEDWVGPMAATAGRICLRIGGTEPRWVRRTPGGEYRCSLPFGSGPSFRRTWERELRRWIDEGEVEPVLAEATPFARSPETGDGEV
jgi:hypothetical protein